MVQVVSKFPQNNVSSTEAMASNAAFASRAEDPSDFEHVLQLPGGKPRRQLHYASAGNPDASTVILMFSGYLSVGTATHAAIPKPFNQDGIHWIAPTIPGNGPSSSTPKNVPYHVNLAETMTALLEHLHPSDNRKGNAIEQLYLAGGSYGSVPCQMLFGASFSRFPYGPKIAGAMLLAPFSPFKWHKDYTKQMTWANWISVGPPSQWVPFRIVPRLLSTVIAAKCKDLKSTRSLMDQLLFSKMSEDEAQRFNTFAETKRGMTGEQLKDEMASTAFRCTVNWDGFLEGPDVLHSDWGFHPARLDDEHSKKPVLVVLSEDDELGDGMGIWLAEKYKHAQLKRIDGGHIAALYHQDECWAELLDMGSTPG